MFAWSYVPTINAVMTIYVRKQEESVYKALLLDSATVYDLKLEVSSISTLLCSLTLTGLCLLGG